jgi:hypothetical protein
MQDIMNSTSLSPSSDIQFDGTSFAVGCGCMLFLCWCAMRPRRRTDDALVRETVLQQNRERLELQRQRDRWRNDPLARAKLINEGVMFQQVAARDDHGNLLVRAFTDETMGEDADDGQDFDTEQRAGDEEEGLKLDDEGEEGISQLNCTNTRERSCTDQDDPDNDGVDEDVYADDGDNQCIICFEDFEVGDIVGWNRDFTRSSCRHVFHKDCICTWLCKPNSNDCPTCRTVLIRPMEGYSASDDLVKAKAEADHGASEPAELEDAIDYVIVQGLVFQGFLSTTVSDYLESYESQSLATQQLDTECFGAAMSSVQAVTPRRRCRASSDEPSPTSVCDLAATEGCDPPFDDGLTVPDLCSFSGSATLNPIRRVQSFPARALFLSDE